MEEMCEIKVSKVKKKIEDKLKQRWERVRGELVGEVEEWSRFKETILEVKEEV